MTGRSISAALFVSAFFVVAHPAAADDAGSKAKPTQPGKTFEDKKSRQQTKPPAPKLKKKKTPPSDPLLAK
jgi:hypothetical protein